MTELVKGKGKILGKAFFSSGTGAPISYGLNILIIPPLLWLFAENVMLAALVITLPFFFVSVFRMFLIDYIFKKYKIDISPQTLVRTLFMWLR